MDRPKHRRFILLGIALLAGGALLMLGRQASSPLQPSTLPVELATTQQTAPEIDRAEPVIADEADNGTESATAAVPARSAMGLRGRIIDAVTRRPVREFSVSLVRIERDGASIRWHEPIVRKFKSETGRFTWDVAAGNWRGAVQAPGYQQFGLAEQEYFAHKPTRELVMPLLRGLALRGRVFDQSTGAGIPEAKVGFRKATDQGDGYEIPTSVQPDADGSFTLDGMPAGEIVLQVSATGYAYRELELAVDEQTPPVEIPLSVGGKIAGVVRTASGEPIKGRVLLEGPALHADELDEAGRFSYEHIPPGSYTIAAQTDAGSASQHVVLGQDERKENVILIVEAGRSLRGVLRGLRPEQLSQAHLTLRTRATRGAFIARPDAHGAYALHGVPPGRAVITVNGGGRYFQKTVEVPADRDAMLDIVFPEGARLSGRITRGGEPAVGKTVWMQSAGDKSAILYSAAASADGRYEIEGLPLGEYRVRAEEDISRLVAIAGDTVLNIDIPLVQLAARVVEDGGAVPIVGADVHVRGSEPATARVHGYKKTDHFGQFTLTGIEPGEIMLMVYKPGYELYREKIAYSSPMTNKTITLRRSAGVEVRVKPGSRRFPRGFTITQYIPGNDYMIDLWMPLDREGVCHVPAALTGTTFHIGRFSGEPIVIEEWDGQSFELP
ncbi:MAG TPA: carboxypeptidase-like regulatory domain-containing protein [Steroidobacteraceae bacterium]|nr:carboxypeptidase-like regulatory domain-containing protein [Steroidobacteraceae bacterium]